MSLGAVVTGLGHGLVSWGFGGPGGATEAQPGYIQLVEKSRRLHVGDIAVFWIDLLTYDESLTDPTELWVEVKPSAGDEFTIDYADGDESVDRITRRGAGKYTLQIECTSARGTGIVHFTVHSTGTLQAVEPGQFIVRSVRV